MAIDEHRVTRRMRAGYNPEAKPRKIKVIRPLRAVQSLKTAQHNRA